MCLDPDAVDGCIGPADPFRELVATFPEKEAVPLLIALDEDFDPEEFLVADVGFLLLDVCLGFLAECV